MKKILFLLSGILSINLAFLSSCGSVTNYDTKYLINLVKETNNKKAMLLPNYQDADSVAVAKNNFDKYLKETQKVEIRDEIIFSCLNFIYKTDNSTEINKAYELKNGDSLISLYETDKILMQTRITNFENSWNDTNQYWDIFSLGIVLSIQFREDYYLNENFTYFKRSTISYDFFPQSAYLKYEAKENGNKFEFNKTIDFVDQDDKNIFGVIEAQINGNNKPLKKIQVLPSETKMVNNYFVNKK